MAKLKEIKLYGGLEKKSGSNPYIDAPFSFYNFLGGGSNGDLRALEAIRLYKNCMPFFKAVELRAETFSSIPIRVKDTSTGKFVDSHPALELIGQSGQPNPAESLTNFLKGYSSFRDITGQSFLIANGLQGRPPTDVLNAKPQSMTIGSAKPNISTVFEVPGSYTWNSTHFSDSFVIQPLESSPSFRYWNKERNREIWQAGEFNPTSSNNNNRGLSKAAAITLEIQQFIEGNTNNLSVLQRGARPSVAWVSQLDEPLTDDQYERWKEQVQSYEGALNAGKQILVDAVEPKVISTTNKDMEFNELRKAMRIDVFVEYHIPLALVSPEQMTLDNLKTAVFQLYDLSVLPHADNLLEELTLFLMPRYKNSENLIFSYNTNDIEALKERAIERTSKLQKILILTDDELRTLIGYEELSEGGDSVWKPMNQVPAEMDRFTDDNLSSPSKQYSQGQVLEFRADCERCLDQHGNKSFTELQIDNMVIEYFPGYSDKS